MTAFLDPFLVIFFENDQKLKIALIRTCRRATVIFKFRAYNRLFLKQSLYLFPHFFKFCRKNLCIVIFKSRYYHFTTGAETTEIVEKFRVYPPTPLRQHFSDPPPTDRDF